MLQIVEAVEIEACREKTCDGCYEEGIESKTNSILMYQVSSRLFLLTTKIAKFNL